MTVLAQASAPSPWEPAYDFALQVLKLLGLLLLLLLRSLQHPSKICSGLQGHS